jgi:hypothetical protein
MDSERDIHAGDGLNNVAYGGSRRTESPPHYD